MFSRLKKAVAWANPATLPSAAINATNPTRSVLPKPPAAPNLKPQSAPQLGSQLPSASKPPDLPKLQQPQPAVSTTDTGFNQFISSIRAPGMRVGNTLGSMVDAQSRDAQQYWARRLQRLQERRGEPLNPAAEARGYLIDLDSRRQIESDTEQTGSLLGRILGFNRLDPRKGTFVPTVDSNIGKNPGGLSKAVASTVAGLPTAVAGGATSLVTGDASPFAAAARDVLSLPNHLLGTDAGHALKPDAAMSSAFEVADPKLRAAFRGDQYSTTPGFFSDVYDPLSGGVKPSVSNAVADMSRFYADDSTSNSSQVGRSLAGMHSTAARNAGDVIAAMTGAKAMPAAGLPAATANPLVAGGIIRGLPTLADTRAGNTVTSRILPAIHNATQGALAPVVANPLVSGVQELADRTGVQDRANAAANWLRQLPGNNAGVVPRSLADFSAGAVESLPSLLPMAAGGAANAAKLSPALTASGIAGAAAKGATRAVSPFAGVSGAVDAVSGLAGKESPQATTNIAQARGQAAAAGANARSQAAGGDAIFKLMPDGSVEKLQQYAASNPQVANGMLSAAGDTIKDVATSPTGQAEIKNVQTTGNISPEAEAQVQYNLLRDGVDPQRMKDWYGQLGGAEKFALWGGLGLSTIGLISAMNEGGIMSWLLSLLGLGAAGFTAANSGLFGDGAQAAAKKISSPFTQIAGVRSQDPGLIDKVTSSPQLMRAIGSVFNQLPDGAVQWLQQKYRQHNPGMAATLDAATGPLNIGGFGSAAARQALVRRYNIPPEAADRWLASWSSNNR